MQFKKLFQVLVLGGAAVDRGRAAARRRTRRKRGRSRRPTPGSTIYSGGGVKGW